MRCVPHDDPLSYFFAVARKLNTLWLRTTYPFARFGRNVNIHPSCTILRPASPWISLADDVYLCPGNWLNVVASG